MDNTYQEQQNSKYREQEELRLNEVQKEIDAEAQLAYLRVAEDNYEVAYKRACLATDRAYWRFGGNASAEYKEAAAREADTRRLYTSAKNRVSNHWGTMYDTAKEG